MHISDWSSDVCSSDLHQSRGVFAGPHCLPPTQFPFCACELPQRNNPGCSFEQECQPQHDEIHQWVRHCLRFPDRSEEHTSELQSLLRITYAVFCLKNNTELHSPIPKLIAVIQIK